MTTRRTFSPLMLALACACALAFAHTATPPRATARRAVALTLDDLPYVNIAGGSYLAKAKRATSELLRVLQSHRAPAIGFVNEAKLNAPGGSALLQQWIDAGMTLGNHTYSHPDFNRLTVEQFQDEIAKGDVVTRLLMESHKPYQLYFRHPMTHTGDTREKKEAIETFLAERGYKVTPHTIENSDFIYNVGFVNAKTKKDEALITRLRDAYLDFTFSATAFAERVSPLIVGRDFPQVLLLHANELNADCLDEMLNRYEALGYRFITLDEAMADPAYHAKDTTVSRDGPTWLWRWSQSLGQHINFTDDPSPPQWVMDLYHQR